MITKKPKGGYVHLSVCEGISGTWRLCYIFAVFETGE